MSIEQRGFERGRDDRGEELQAVRDQVVGLTADLQLVRGERDAIRQDRDAVWQDRDALVVLPGGPDRAIDPPQEREHLCHRFCETPH